jgi:hypothetical protein
MDKARDVSYHDKRSTNAVIDRAVSPQIPDKSRIEILMARTVLYLPLSRETYCGDHVDVFQHEELMVCSCRSLSIFIDYIIHSQEVQDT